MTAALAKRAIEPVRAYLASARLAWIDDPHGFAARFTAGAAIERAAVEATLPFRRAVVPALLAEVREARMATGACSGCDCKQPCETPLDPQAFEAFERAWACAVIAEASQRAARASHDENDADAWEIYRRTALEGAETTRIARERGITTTDARTRAARAAARFDAALRETLAEEGVAAEDADDELAWLMDAALR